MIDNRYTIRCFVPDLPTRSDLMPYLEYIDENRWYTNFGPLILEYENRLAEITGAKVMGGKCNTLASGTTSLELAITALNLPVGSKVLLPSFTFPATLLAILRCRLQPIFSDVDEHSWTLTPTIARIALRHHLYALILPVACFGLPLPSEEWDYFTQETSIPVLMDAAAVLGFQQIGKTTHAAFSLHATKPLGVGEGGVFATADLDMAEKVRCMSNFGFHQGLVTNSAAANAKLSEYTAAVGLAQLARWPTLLARRRSIWKMYYTALQNLSGISLQPFTELMPPAVLSISLTMAAEKVAHALAEAGIETRRWYAPPLHRHPPFTTIKLVGSSDGNDLPVTEKLFRNSIGLPFHNFLTHDDVLTVVNKLQVIGEKYDD